MTAARAPAKTEAEPSIAPPPIDWQGVGHDETYNLGGAVCLLAVLDIPLRQALRSGLRDHGVENLVECGTTVDVRESVVDARPDLIVCDRDLPDGSVPDLIRAIRHGEIGDNPFSVIVTLTAPALSDRVLGLVGAGADDVISRPVSPAKVIRRVTQMIAARKPFVVTSEYTGPDRRCGKRSEATPPENLIEVPNTLRLKALGSFRPDTARAEIEALRASFNLRKVERHAERIVYLSNLILPVLRDGLDSETLRLRLRQIGVLATDIFRRVVGTEYGPVADLCESLCAAAARLDCAAPEATDVQLLYQLTLAIDRAFEDGPNGVATAREIADFVHRVDAQGDRRSIEQAIRANS